MIVQQQPGPFGLGCCVLFCLLPKNVYKKTFPPIGVVAIPQGSFSCPCGAIHLQYAILRFRLSAKTPPACLRLSAALSGGCLRHAPAGAALLLRFPPGPLRWVPAVALSRMGSGIFPKQNISPHPLRRRMGGLLIDGIVVQWSIPRAFFKLPFSLGEETGGTLVSPILKTSGTRRF